MARLVVKKEIGLELAQELALGHAAQKHGFIHCDLPAHQRLDGPLVCGRAARRDQCGADAHGRRAALLQAVQGRQKGLERPGGQGQQGLFDLVGLEGVEP